VGVVQQEARPAALLVAATDPPDRGRVALQAGGHRVDRLASGDGQDDPSMLYLEPGQVPGAGHRLEDREVRGSDREGARLAAAHDRASDAEQGSAYSIPLP
jgi:hypothetical protein